MIAILRIIFVLYTIQLWILTILSSLKNFDAFMSDDELIRNLVPFYWLSYVVKAFKSKR